MVTETMNHDEQSTSGTLFVRDIDRIDCAVFDPSIGVIGQSWYVDIEVDGQLDQNGFVYDFSQLKKLVKAVLKQTVDHALLIPIMSKHVHFQETELGELWQLKAKTRLTGLDSDWTYQCPKGAVYPVRTIKITQEILEQECSKLIRHRLGNTIHRVDIKLRSEAANNGDSFFRYTHGITHHEGLCQRLFHGHRSRIEVYIADERRRDLEQYIAHDVFGSIIHVASINQIKDAKFDPRSRPTGQEPITLAYESSLGYYEAKIPANRIFFVEKETSVEWLAKEIATLLAEQTQEPAIKVRCFEGIGKGAVAEV